MPKFIKAITQERFIQQFYSGVKDFISLDNDLVSDDVQNILKNETNRKDFLEKIDELRTDESIHEVQIGKGSNSFKVRSL